MASWRRPPGRPRNVWLNKVQEDADAIPCCGDLRLPGVTERRISSSGLHDDDDDDDDVPPTPESTPCNIFLRTRLTSDVGNADR